jgi:hypothetical protein
VPLSALRATLPVFKNPANRHRAVSLPPNSSGTPSATPSPRRSHANSSTAGPSPHRASRCTRPPQPTSTRTRRPR